MGDTLAGEQERRVKRLKRVVEGWRVVLLQLRAVMVWEQAWHPAATFTVITVMYLLLWLLELNTLTLIATIGIIINVVDFLVPLATAQLVSADAWTGQQEKQLEELCRRLVQAYAAAAGNVLGFYQLRQTKPILYYGLSVSGLFLLLWLGKSVHNGCLLYVASVAVALLPGLLHRGYPQKALSMIRSSTIKKEN